MKNIITLIGARPQIIKASALSREINNNFHSQLNEIIVHTGQHYDANMSDIFFEEMDIPTPKYNLSVGSGRHGDQTAKIISKFEKILVKEVPTGIILYGDTNSTLAGSIAASKLQIPVIHIEAGLRSNNKKMPEEINRILCDQVSTFLFCPTQIGMDNLENEGFNINSNPPYSIDNPAIFNSGDVMLDNSLHFYSIAEKKSNILGRLKLIPDHYILTTIHRDYNTDNINRLQILLLSLLNLADKYKINIVFPIHPRTLKKINNDISAKIKSRFYNSNFIQVIEPVTFFEMLVLENNSKLIMTDSGGVQKEAYFYKKPVIIIRTETEWLEIVKNGTGIVTDINRENIFNAYSSLEKKDLSFPPVFGDGHAASFICNKIVNEL